MAIVGTGLTMADVVASLAMTRLGHRGPVLAFSRRGQLSRANLSGEWPEWTLAAQPQPSARHWLRHIRDEVARAAAQELPWQVVLDAVRNQGQTIWQGLTFADRQRFLRHLRSYWDVHRYRIAPQAADVLSQRSNDGSLKVLAASLRGDSDTHPQQLEITLRQRDGTRQNHVR